MVYIEHLHLIKFSAFLSAIKKEERENHQIDKGISNMYLSFFIKHLNHYFDVDIFPFFASSYISSGSNFCKQITNCNNWDNLNSSALVWYLLGLLYLPFILQGWQAPPIFEIFKGKSLWGPHHFYSAGNTMAHYDWAAINFKNMTTPLLSMYIFNLLTYQCTC